MTDQFAGTPLEGMTQARWDALPYAERIRVRDNSKLHPKLRGLEGLRVKVTPKRGYRRSTFRVGITTGWQPVHLAVREGDSGSTDLINACEEFHTVEVL